jgi:hypothetical protein
MRSNRAGILQTTYRRRQLFGGYGMDGGEEYGEGYGGCTSKTTRLDI